MTATPIDIEELKKMRPIMDIPYPRKLYEEIRKGSTVDFREVVRTGMVISYFTYDLDVAMQMQNEFKLRVAAMKDSCIIIDENEEQKRMDRFLEINRNNDTIDRQGLDDLFTLVCVYSPFYSKYQDERPRLASRILTIEFENHLAYYLVFASHPDLVVDQRLDQYADAFLHRMRVKIKETEGNELKSKFQDVHITIDEIDSFAEITKIPKSANKLPIRESQFKKGIQIILNESGTFKDWGGEKNDLLTTNLKFNGKRTLTAFAFKGRGVGGILTPNKMGKKGDQIQRLFDSSADIFILQYWDQVGQEIIEQMRTYAQKKSVEQQKKIYWCIIDGADTYRICEAYKDRFPKDLIE